MIKNNEIKFIFVALFMAMITGNASADEIYYVHSDHLNTSTAVTNQNKQVAWQAERKPFSETEVVVNKSRDKAG